MPTLFGVAGCQWLRQAVLTPTARVIIDGFLHLLEELEFEQEREPAGNCWALLRLGKIGADRRK